MGMIICYSPRPKLESLTTFDVDVVVRKMGIMEVWGFK